MKRSSAVVLQIAVAVVGIATLALMLWEPHLEGRNAQATAFEIYFRDPFLAYVYLGSIPFFMALRRAFGLFGHAGRSGSFSHTTVEALKSIKTCALVLIGFIIGALGLILAFGDDEDRPAGVFMGLLAIAGSSTIALSATSWARKLQNTLPRPEATEA